MSYKLTKDALKEALEEKLLEIWQSGGIGREALREELRQRFIFIQEPEYIIHQRDDPIIRSGVDTPAVYYDVNLSPPYRMLMSASAQPAEDKLGYCESFDGKKWSNFKVAFESANSPWADAERFKPGGIVKVSNTYYIAYTSTEGGQRKIGCFTTDDFVTFTDVGSVILEGDSLDVGVGEDVSDPHLKYYNGKFYLIYTGWGAERIYRVFLATGESITDLSKHGEILRAHPEYDERHIFTLSTLTPDEGEGKWWLFYNVIHYQTYLGESWNSINVASGGSLKTLVKHGEVLAASMARPEPYPGWDFVDDPYIIRIGNTLKLWCGTVHNSGIVYAEAPVDGLLKSNFKAISPVEGKIWRDYFRDSTHPYSPWNNKAISAGDTSGPVSCLGFDNKVVYFISNVAGEVTVQILEPDGTWRDYYSEAVAANELTAIVITAPAEFVRLTFNQDATVTAWGVFS